MKKMFFALIFFLLTQLLALELLIAVKDILESRNKKRFYE